MEKSVNTNQKQHRNDIFMIVGVLLFALAIFVGYKFVYTQDGREVVVTVDGQEYARLSLGEEKTLDIRTKNGINRLRIQNGYADMVEADCDDRLCVDQRKISKKGETIICLPHKIVVEVISGDNSGMDGVVG